MHISASVLINDDEPRLHHDSEVWLEKLAHLHPRRNSSTTAPTKTTLTPI